MASSAIVPTVKWSVRIATIAGIQVRIHLTFFLLLGFFAWIYYTDGGPQAAVDGVAFTLLIFLCVLLHEFGHAFAARAFGIRTPDITLLPIGGVARLERMPSNPRQELLIAIAGPAVNVVIAIAIFLVIGGVLPIHEFVLIDTASGSLLAKLLFVNVLLVLFNLIRLFPWTAGVKLRLLATQMRYSTATGIAARVDRLSPPFGVASVTLWGWPTLAIKALLFMGAQQELAYARFREAAQGLRVGQAMITRFRALPISLKVADIATSLAESSQEVFPFVDERLHLHGIADRYDLEKASLALPPGAAASSVARTLPTVNPETGLGEALELMRESSKSLLPVVNASGQIVGLVGIGQLAELSASKQPGVRI
jgi:stage IV sporulation protein FB